MVVIVLGGVFLLIIFLIQLGAGKAASKISEGSKEEKKKIEEKVKRKTGLIIAFVIAIGMILVFLSIGDWRCHFGP